MKAQDRIPEWHDNNRKRGRPTETIVQAGPIHIVRSTEPDGGNARVNLLRNDSLFLVPTIRTQEKEHRSKLFTLLTTEYRSGAGRESMQFPAETLETGEHLINAAWRAFDEETSIKREWVRDIALLNLGEYNYVSPGSTNEQLWYTHADVELPAGVYLEELHDRITGLAEHGERIVTSIHEFRHELFYELCNAADKLALLLILEKITEERE